MSPTRHEVPDPGYPSDPSDPTAVPGDPTVPTGDPTAVPGDPTVPAPSADPTAPADPTVPAPTQDTAPAPTPTYDPATDPTVVTDVPKRPDPADLQTTRIWREGDPDFDAASDSSHTAQGNKYPQSYDSAAAEADAAEAEVVRLEGELELAKQVAEAARAKADYLQDNTDSATAERTTVSATP